DFSRNAGAIAKRHQDQVASGKTQIGRDPRALASNWTFGYLNDDLRAHRINVRDVLGGDALPMFLGGTIDFFDPAVERSGNRVPKMKKSVFLEADVDKHRLQTHLDIL